MKRIYIRSIYRCVRDRDKVEKLSLSKLYFLYRDKDKIEKLSLSKLYLKYTSKDKIEKMSVPHRVKLEGQLSLSLSLQSKYIELEWFLAVFCR